MAHSDARAPRRVVVVGASAGGVQALTRLVAGLDAELDASLLVVLHLPRNAHSVLPDILGRAGPLPAAHPRDREPLVSGQVYVAPPNRHLLVHDGLVRTTVGPAENGHRPSIDVLFRSAAHWYASSVISVVLSGALDDGSAGVAAVAQQGGAVLVQDPAQAEVSEMPRHALQTVPDAVVLPIEEIARRINTLTSEAPVPKRVRPASNAAFATELLIAEGERRTPDDLDAAPAGLGCPDCGGSLFELSDTEVLRYRCRVGHAWTADALAHAHVRKLEEALWTALRVLEDDEAVQTRVVSRLQGSGSVRPAERYEAIRADREQLMKTLRDAIAHVAHEPAEVYRGSDPGDEFG
jgi:two-component system, chemotaxis family, protein-glutamate methylesterase/glutaminase